MLSISPHPHSMQTSPTVMDHPELTLVQANKEQVVISRKRHSKEWAHGLSTEQYLAREERFEQLAHASNGKLVIWVLVPINDPQTLDFFCSCETFRRSVLRVRPSSIEPEEVTAYAIASVFCPPEHRRNGYASHMMRLLHHVLSPRSTYHVPLEFSISPGAGGDALFSVLYSDVGEFYKKCGPVPGALGWDIRGAVSTRWPTTLPVDPSDPPATLLTLDQCKIIWDADAKHMYDVLKGQPLLPHVTRFTFLPNAGVAAFPAIRAAAFFTSRPPEHWGIALPHTPEGSPTYATWTLDERVLVVTRLRATSSMLPALMRALANVARTLDATAVEAWALAPELAHVAARWGGKTGPRTDHLPAIVWYGPEELSAVEWLYNEKFAWC